ncbi:beta-lactamase family protein [Parasphingopyxis algicola]|uniref:serine hydrolase domain-containing protein n=1 Tax=Parasphingopyxis algicola TaxID=2026624 RepID=UPI0015A048D1|nr:serine hydrolase domain-containing protein [Parasphingopyxis algicola]QLC25236.1 beta-lactamase family protein [Parasphingopyxis algicola]
MHIVSTALSRAMLLMLLAVPAGASAQPDEAPPLALNRETLETQIDAFMAANGYAGVVFVALDGETLVEKAYGMAHADLGVPITLDTAFGIGSRPIDFTTAAIYLLEQRGRLSQDDTLSDYLDNVPADRAGMTIRQMMTGRSGLPDFPANDRDWDADLGWIDRTEFERRTLAIPLLFAPGEGEAHSHWAFGMLAAIVERVSGQGYSGFLRENFFDPAGMERTGDYGESRGLTMADFAAGGGVQRGLPNIPPNWGPTSWLVLGSGGMFSTLGDLRRFYIFVTQSGVLEPRYTEHFLSARAGLDGSDRGFELFSFTDENFTDEAYVMLSQSGEEGSIMAIVRPLVALLRDN